MHVDFKEILCKAYRVWIRAAVSLNGDCSDVGCSGCLCGVCVSTATSPVLQCLWGQYQGKKP